MINRLVDDEIQNGDVNFEVDDDESLTQEMMAKVEKEGTVKTRNSAPAYEAYQFLFCKIFSAVE